MHACLTLHYMTRQCTTLHHTRLHHVSSNSHTCTHAYINDLHYIHTHIYIYVHHIYTDIEDIHTQVLTRINACIRSCIHTCIPTYMDYTTLQDYTLHYLLYTCTNTHKSSSHYTTPRCSTLHEFKGLLNYFALHTIIKFYTSVHTCIRAMHQIHYRHYVQNDIFGDVSPGKAASQVG